MPPENVLSLPFLTRKMFDFEFGAAFGIRITSQADTPSIITIRGATKAGPFVLAHTPTSDSVPKIEDFRLPDVPLWITMQITDINIFRGQTFARIGLTINGDYIQDLASGYISSTNGISWPNTNLQESQPPIGYKIANTGSDPAAGVEVSISVPNNQMWRIYGFRVTLVTAAAAANRVVHVIFQNTAQTIYEGISSVTQIISETKTYHVQPQPTSLSLSDDNDIIIPMPAFIDLFPGDTITTETTAKNAGDNYGIPVVAYERFFINYTGA